jgi:hypothetical protein
MTTSALPKIRAQGFKKIKWGFEKIKERHNLMRWTAFSV